MKAEETLQGEMAAIAKWYQIPVQKASYDKTRFSYDNVMDTILVGGYSPNVLLKEGNGAEARASPATLSPSRTSRFCYSLTSTV
jgi:hypothetical protein